MISLSPSLPTITFNRTSMELKPGTKRFEWTVEAPFNRTSMELKR